MKFRFPRGILGGILRYGFNPIAILHAWFVVFEVRDAERMRLKREARLLLESEAKPLESSQTENDSGHHRE